VVSAGFQQRSMKTHAGAVGVVGLRVAQDDASDASTSVAIIKAMSILIPRASPMPISWTYASAYIWLTVLTMRLPVLGVLSCQRYLQGGVHHFPPHNPRPASRASCWSFQNSA
jgi:hypothetical protein